MKNKHLIFCNTNQLTEYKLWAIFLTTMILLALTGKSFRVSASQTAILINEIYASPTSGTAEWLEIYNAGETTVDLTDWKIAELQSGLPKNHEQIVEINVDKKSWLLPGEYLVLYNNKLTLNNNGDTIYLFDQDDEIRNIITYPPLKEKSYARTPNGSETWNIVEPSPGSANQNVKDVIPTDTIEIRASKNLITPLSSAESTNNDHQPTIITLQLSEIMACPLTGEPEWLEVYNTSDQDWLMDGWKVKNSKGTSRSIHGVPFKANSLVVINFSSGLLGNGGDGLTLEKPNGETILSAEFEACKEKGSSYIFDGENWQETIKPTPENHNEYKKVGADSAEAANLQSKLAASAGNLKTEITDKENNNDSDSKNQEKMDTQNQNTQKETKESNISDKFWSYLKLNLTDQEKLWIDKDISKNSSASAIKNSSTATTIKKNTNSKTAPKEIINYNSSDDRWSRAIFIGGLSISILLLVISGGGFLYLHYKNLILGQEDDVKNEVDVQDDSRQSFMSVFGGNGSKEKAFGDLF